MELLLCAVLFSFELCITFSLCVKTVFKTVKHSEICCGGSLESVSIDVVDEAADVVGVNSVTSVVS